MKLLQTMLLCAIFAISVKADTLTLQKAYLLAEENYPAIKQRPLYDQATELKLKNLTAKYYPQFLVNGQITYQSEMPEIALPGFQPLPKDHYQANIDLSQTIYDGGLVKANKKLENAQHAINMQSVETDLYNVRGRVNTYFFTMLVLQKRQEILDSSANVLNTRLKQLQVGYKNGAVLESDVLKIQAELLKIGQTTSDNSSSRKAMADALSVLLGDTVTLQTVFELPNEADTDVKAPLGPGTVPSDFLGKERPEYKLFELQAEKLKQTNKLIQANTLPRLSAFAQGGISYPNAFNFLDASTQPFYIVGVKLGWNL
jgi:outer membrane protein TolC